MNDITEEKVTEYMKWLKGDISKLMERSADKAREMDIDPVAHAVLTTSTFLEAGVLVLAAFGKATKLDPEIARGIIQDEYTNSLTKIFKKVYAKGKMEA